MWSSAVTLSVLAVACCSAGPRQLPASLLDQPGYLKATTTAPQAFLRSMCVTPRGMFRHPHDCHKYLDCWDGRVLEKFCPDGLVFSDLPGGFCDFPQFVECGGRTQTTPTPGTDSGNEEPHAPVSLSPAPTPATSTTPKTTAPTTTIPQVADLVKLGDGYYVFVNSKQLNWVEARQHCKGLGLDLLTIETAQENQLINSQVKLLLTSGGAPNYYIGATDEGREGTFYWVATGKDVTYASWGGGEPNNGGGLAGNQENCAELLNFGQPDLRWNDIPCALRRSFVCELFFPATRAGAIPTLIKNDAAFQKGDNSTSIPQTGGNRSPYET